jgi:F-type H+-transporting ATPase subunit delta
VIEKAFRGRASDLLVDSLQVIGRKGRLGSLRAVATEYRKALRHLRGGMDVHIRTAVPLTDALRARLTDAITAAVDRKPTLIEHVDPSLVAGVVIELEGRKVDASLASRLHQLTEALLARASREIQSGKAYVAES